MDRIEDCISFQVGKAAQQVNRRARQLLAPYGVTPIQYAVLKVLSQTEAMSGVAIGERLVLDSASITGVLDRLEGAGLVERRRHPTDRRAQLVAATPRATGMMSQLDAAMDRLNREAADPMDVENAAFRNRLRRLGDAKHWEFDV